MRTSPARASFFRCAQLLGVAAAVAFVPCSGPAYAQGASFQGLGDLAGGGVNSAAFAISDDGTFVVGQSVSSNGVEAFRWTAAGGMVGLGDLPGGIFASAANAVSADGAVVVGDGRNASGNEAFRWTAAGGIVGLGFLSGGDSSFGLGVSDDGNVAVGSSQLPDGSKAYRWTAAGGMVNLGTLGGGNPPTSTAAGTSADGAVVVGSSAIADGRNEAFRWTAAGGMVGLGDIPTGSFQSFAYAVSADGNVVVGESNSVNGIEPFRWTAAGGMQGLGFLPGCVSGRGQAVSADGSVVVGACGSGDAAFVWTAAAGMRRLRDVLVAQGVDLTGWTLLEARGISADGRVIVGRALNPQGTGEAYRAVLAPDGHRWIDPTGGSWDVASNWEPATVPGPGDRVRFDIPGTYTVFGNPAFGPRSVLGLHANDGTIDFELDNLTLVSISLDQPSLAVSADAIAKIVSGSSEMVDATIGYDDNAAGDTTTVARLQVFNAGTTLVGTGELVVGGGGGTARGEVFVAAGELETSSAVVGGLSIGEAVVGNEGEWTVNERLSVGFAETGRLTIENGGRVIASSVTVSELLIGDREGFILVTGSGPSRRSQLLVLDTLVVAGTGLGRLNVREGATVTTAHLVVGRDSLVGVVSVSGQGGGVSSELAATSITVGDAGAGFHTLLIAAGGIVTAGSLRAGRTGTAGVVGVDGTAGASFLGINGDCTIQGIALDIFPSSLAVTGPGATARCLSSTVVGGGNVDVGGIATFIVRGVMNVENGTVHLDGGFLDGVDVNGTPTPDVADVVVLPAGSISGLGFLIGTLDASGPVGVGIQLVPPPREGGQAIASRGTAGGTLQVSGRVVLRPSASLEIALAGPDTTTQGRLRVRPRSGFPSLDGSAALDGTLRLNFSDGYAPQAGDTFLLLDATSTTGSFASTEVIGLEPGWLFELEIVNGTVVLHSQSNGVPTTPAEPSTPTASRLTLHPPAPNPVAGSTTLRYELPAAGRVRLAVYDALGREVAVLVDGERPAGAHELSLDTSTFRSGPYVLRVTAGGRALGRLFTVTR